MGPHRADSPPLPPSPSPFISSSGPHALSPTHLARMPPEAAREALSPPARRDGQDIMDLVSPADLGPCTACLSVPPHSPSPRLVVRCRQSGPRPGLGSDNAQVLPTRALLAPQAPSQEQCRRLRPRGGAREPHSGRCPGQAGGGGGTRAPPWVPWDQGLQIRGEGFAPEAPGPGPTPSGLAGSCSWPGVKKSPWPTWVGATLSKACGFHAVLPVGSVDNKFLVPWEDNPRGGAHSFWLGGGRGSGWTARGR